MSFEKFTEAQEAWQRSKRIHSLRLIHQVVPADPCNEQACLMMTHIVNKRYQVDGCLEQVLLINPGNAFCQRAPRAINSETSIQTSRGKPIVQIASFHPVKSQEAAMNTRTYGKHQP
jgi:hypothetical protein